ncbi:camp-dependent protein kinase regulatory subunit [Umbelopsis sp. PMI_123]|nr:camp-dependent protein kinase regulatory subunit [Umbelopsis sp. PMI_123]
MAFAPSDFKNKALAEEYQAILNDLNKAVHENQPDDVLQFCANFFSRRLEHDRTQSRQTTTGEAPHEHVTEDAGHPHDLQSLQFPPVADIEPTDQTHLTDSSDEEDLDDEARDTFGSMPAMDAGAGHNRGRRTSVSAESIQPSANPNYVRKVIPKTQEQRERIRLAVQNNFLFKNFDEEQYQDVVNAMEEKRVPPNTTVIEQGAVGDFFYIVESGTLDCFISKDGGSPLKVTEYSAGGSFGELALMYNAPRAATLITTSDSVLWALDRITFRSILMEITSRKRRMYESFLEEVPLLKPLELYERHKIADALESVYFEDGEEVVKEGDVGDIFYMVESGQAIAYKNAPDGSKQEVYRYEKGGYFGELALLNDSPRAATVVAVGRLKCATLGKKAFTRLLGPVREILNRNSENYQGSK